jgi:hypothetical protein
VTESKVEALNQESEVHTIVDGSVEVATLKDTNQ